MEHVVSKNKCIPLKTLQQYKKGSVNKQEKSAVEAHLPTCELCSYTVASTTKINEKELAEDLPTLRRSITDTLMERKKVKRQQAGNQGQQGNQRRKLYSIAAALAFLVALGLAVQVFINANNSENLYAQYYQSYDVPEDLLRSVTVATEPPIDPGIITIDSNTPPSQNNPRISESLAQAIATYKDIPYKASSIPSSFNQDPHEAALTQLLQGLTQLEKGNITAAIPILEKVQKSKTTYKEDATWYLALAHLKKEDNATAIRLLDQLLALNNGFYYEDAKALKAKLQ